MDFIFNYKLNVSLRYMLASIPVFVLSFFFIYRNKQKNKVISASTALMVTYIFIVFASTVFCRPEKSYYDYNLTPFWSYRNVIKYHDMKLLSEDILNCILLLPAGVLYQISSGKSVKRAALLGFCISVTMEILQLILKRGLFEFDDIFHNTLGCAAGAYFIKMAVEKFNKVCFNKNTSNR